MEFPVTTFYAALMGLLLVYLSDRVSRHRKQFNVSLGTGSEEALERAIRAHGNFVEYVPLGLLLLMFLESDAGQDWLLHALGFMLLVGRLLHAWGMEHPDAPISGRFWGTALTWLMVLSASLLNLWHLL
ncbi:MAG: hypothetical protein GTN86_00210 [Xanthomonadales bacterium]|nr:hypothetical protein [Xanthomonadales bacterium]NIN58253.1 hypothetical protein [Xanthomonadales bacterium]NIN73605.1 hypothetical protein [Xanthomonadales bacterium]NIO14387.1 hypothetical protein [Xanthomonadales bacterium]NIP10646.1 hypothetical protein [Xanthomonadales bacterium]